MSATPPIPSRRVVRNHPPLSVMSGVFTLSSGAPLLLETWDITKGLASRLRLQDPLATANNVAVGPVLDLFVYPTTLGAVYLMIQEAVCANGGGIPTWSPVKSLLCPLSVVTRETHRIGGTHLRLIYAPNVNNTTADIMVAIRPE